MRVAKLQLRFVTVVVTAVCLAMLGAPSAFALDAIQPAPSAYVIQTFGDDPLGTLGPKLTVRLDPGHPDGYYGWFVSPVAVSVTADRVANVRYAWDWPDGDWRPYDAPLIAPEGKHVLYVQGDDGAHAGPLTAIEVKTDLRSRPVNGSEFAVLDTPTPDPGTANGAVNVQATVNPWAGPHAVRLWGIDRYATSQQIATADFRSAPVAIIARGDEFPDALAASSIAGLYDAPILLTRPGVLPTDTARALTTLRTTRVIITGGTGAVSGAVERTLNRRGITVERIGGIDRYETAALIATAVVKRGGQRGAAFVARGDLYPDSLAVSPFAFRAKRPILLVRPDSLPPVTAKAIRDLGIRDVLIAGSSGAVSPGVEGSIRTQSVRTGRAGGVDRYETAVLAARYGLGQKLGSYQTMSIASGENFPDALCGGVAMGHLFGVILMTPRDTLAPVTASELATAGPVLRDVQVFGGEAAVSKKVWDAILQTIR